MRCFNLPRRLAGVDGGIDPFYCWHPEAVLVRSTFSLGRWKYYRTSRLVEGLRLVMLDKDQDC